MTELDELFRQADEWIAEAKRGLREALPAMLIQQASYEAYIKDLKEHPGSLFGYAPPIPTGGFARVPQPVVQECAAAVAKIFRKRLVELNKAIETAQQS